jgi:hypothetical protein
MKRPSFQFYPADWRKDPALRACSIEARGFWIDLLCIMHESENCGFLEINLKKISEKALASMCGITPSKCAKYLAELGENGVFSRDERGVIYSRRMLRDRKLSEIRREAGKQGGNPSLVKRVDNQTNGNLLNQSANQKPTPSSSSSSSDIVVVDAARARGAAPTNPEWWEEMPTDNANRMDQIQSRINSLHPSWRKRPHFTGKEFDALMANSRPWQAVEEDDWALLTAYMAARIPIEWKSDPRDFLQPDNRLGLIGVGPTTLLGLADRWKRKADKAGIPTGLKPEPEQKIA